MSALPKKITLVACQDMNFGNIGGIGNRNLKEGEEAEFYDTPEIRDLVDSGLLKESKGEKKDVFAELKKIKGIGEETISDIRKVYETIDELKVALLNENCPLRNDICDLLKSTLINTGNN